MSMDASEVRVLGADFTGVGEAVEALVAVATRKTGMDVQRDAKIMAPVDTGNLRSSISMDHTRTRDVLEAVVGPTADYGIYQELGTSHGVPPHPYLFPSLERHREPFVTAVNQAGRMALENGL